MSGAVDNSFRLSKIEEELEKLDIPQLEREPYSGVRGHRRNVLSSTADNHSDNMKIPLDDQLIYSKAVIRPDPEKEAVKKILEKYDSLGKVGTVNVGGGDAGGEKGKWRPLHEVDSHSDESLAISAGNNTQGAPVTLQGYSTASLGRRRDVGPLHGPPGAVHVGHIMQAGNAPRDEYIHIAPEVVAEFPVPAAPMSNMKARDRTLKDADILQVEMFFRSHRTDVYVCTCIVHMYFGSFHHGSPVKSSPSSPTGQSQQQPDNWRYIKSGLLVLIMDNGEARSRGRRIAVVLSEKGTGFQIWKDSINQLTDYKAASMGFHTMHLSTDHMRRVGFGFDDTVCASDFHRKLLSVTTNPHHADMLSVTGGTKNFLRRWRKEERKNHKKYRAPSKSDISSPCCFTHITKLDKMDGYNIVGAAQAGGGGTALVGHGTSGSSMAGGRQGQRDLRTRRLSPVKMTRVSSLIDPDRP